ncbi:MAG: shikimate kinase / 3-dehydroquinate synthase [Solirubrobacteraceae bacterium]|nr:shikimate kinase / 3-dehydroquinate synthase [Solirubrobacteraceae bacterium]
MAPVSDGRALVFIGFMGAGKSSAARAAAGAPHGQALDADALLEERLGRSIADEFAAAGEESFRAKEEELVCELLERAGDGDAVALGGGAVLSERVRAALARHVVVHLEVDASLAWKRATRASAPDRPLARDRDAFTALHAERAPLYESLAAAVLPAGDKRLVGRASSALRRLAAAPAGTRMLWATSASGDYPVFVGRGLLGAGVWPTTTGNDRSFCVTDATVGPLYASRLGELAGTTCFPAGEPSKTLATAEQVWRDLARMGMTRLDRVLALGGGVVGDLAGFCAATYQRGVPVVHLPTTLVAQVDSAYGGKTGVDLPDAKNYVGAYHQPLGVVADVETLETLPRAEWAAGYAEVVKTALIAGGELWRRIAAGEQVDDRVIFDCVRCKLAVVASDERDAGPRQALNLGHTVGHAIETATGYARYRHGEAVALGLLAALRLSGRDELLAQVRSLLQDAGLPTRLEGADPGAVVEAVGRDKKRRDGAVPFVLVDAPGDVRTGCRVADRDLLGAVEELAAR